jgi:hypothetical protein
MAFKLDTARAAVGLSEARSQDWQPLSNVRLEIRQASHGGHRTRSRKPPNFNRSLRPQGDASAAGVPSYPTGCSSLPFKLEGLVSGKSRWASGECSKAPNSPPGA